MSQRARRADGREILPVPERETRDDRDAQCPHEPLDHILDRGRRTLHCERCERGSQSTNSPMQMPAHSSNIPAFQRCVRYRSILHSSSPTSSSRRILPRVATAHGVPRSDERRESVPPTSPLRGASDQRTRDVAGAGDGAGLRLAHQRVQKARWRRGARRAELREHRSPERHEGRLLPKRSVQRRDVAEARRTAWDFRRSTRSRAVAGAVRSHGRRRGRRSHRRSDPRKRPRCQLPAPPELRPHTPQRG